MAASLATASALPTTSRRNSGRYFSIQGASKLLEEEEEEGPAPALEDVAKDDICIFSQWPLLFSPSPEYHKYQISLRTWEGDFKIQINCSIG